MHDIRSMDKIESAWILNSLNTSVIKLSYPYYHRRRMQIFFIFADVTIPAKPSRLNQYKNKEQS